MKLSEITNLDAIRSIDNATELFKNNSYKGRDYIEKFIGLHIHRSGFYGRLIGDEIIPLERLDTTFNQPDDVVILIEGYVSLSKEPVNNGAGGITYVGYGTLLVNGGVKYGGASGGGTVDSSKTTDFSPVDAGGTTFRVSSPTDVDITINEDSCPIGQCIEFTQVGIGQLFLLAGDIVFEADVYTSFKSAGQGSTIGVYHAAPGIYNVFGQIE